MWAGDVVGPAFPEVPVGTDNLLGLEVMGAETAAFNFAANLWSLHYLRLTNQIQPGITYEVSGGDALVGSSVRWLPLGIAYTRAHAC